MNKLAGIFQRVPLFGPLVDCTWPDHWEAIREITVELFWSMMPLWLGAFVIVLQASQRRPTLTAALLTTISNGELLLYAASLLSPIFWIALHDRPRAKVFPSKLPHMVLTAFVIAFAAFTFGLQRSTLQLDGGVVLSSSLAFFVIAVVLLYLATVYNNARLNARDEFQNQERDFLNGYREHKK